MTGMTIGTRLDKAMRDARIPSQQALAQASGVPQPTISRILKNGGKKGPETATLVKLAHTHPLIRELSTSPEYQVDVGHRQLQFHNTNGLVSNPSWEIGLQKTGYIAEAGRCLVMQASMAGRKLIMVFLDSSGRYTRLADAERVRKWINARFPKTAS